MNLKGFTSTSYDKECAIGFALFDSDDTEHKPVLWRINWKGNSHHFRLNDEEYSAYPDEQEVLLYDGEPMKITFVDFNYTIPDDSKYKGKVLTYIEMQRLCV